MLPHTHPTSHINTLSQQATHQSEASLCIYHPAIKHHDFHYFQGRFFWGGGLGGGRETDLPFILSTQPSHSLPFQEAQQIPTYFKQGKKTTLQKGGGARGKKRGETQPNTHTHTHSMRKKILFLQSLFLHAKTRRPVNGKAGLSIEELIFYSTSPLQTPQPG